MNNYNLELGRISVKDLIINFIAKRFVKNFANKLIRFGDTLNTKQKGLRLLIEYAILFTVPTPRPIREFFDLLLITLFNWIRNQQLMCCLLKNFLKNFLINEINFFGRMIFWHVYTQYFFSEIFENVAIRSVCHKGRVIGAKRRDLCCFLNCCGYFNRKCILYFIIYILFLF